MHSHETNNLNHVHPATSNEVFDAVSEVKNTILSLIYKMDHLRTSTEEAEVKRLASIAITELEGASMWAVKTLTYFK